VNSYLNDPDPPGKMLRILIPEFRLVQQEDLSDSFGTYGEVSTYIINITFVLLASLILVTTIKELGNLKIIF
jgi:hypothetical protein